MEKFYKEILIHFLTLPTCFCRISKDAGEQEPYCLLIIQRQLLLKDFKASCQTFNYISQLASLQKGVSTLLHKAFWEEEVSVKKPVRLHCKIIVELSNCSQKAEEQEDGQEPSPNYSVHCWGTEALMDPSWKSPHLLSVTNILQKWCVLGQNEGEFPL